MSDVDIDRPAPGILPRWRVAVRVLLLGLLAGLVGIGAHLAGGGALPTTCMSLVSVAVVAGPAAFLAQAQATRHRSTWRAFVALGSGQLGIELVMQANDRSVEGPLITVAVHLAANVVLGVMLVGADRVLADLVAALARVLPCPGGPSCPPARPGHSRLTGRVVLPASCAITPCSVRGPPRPGVPA